MPDLAFDEAQAILALPKVALSEMVWGERSNHAGHVVAVSPLVDSNGITIPGLTVVFEMRKGVVSDQCLFFFSLMKRIGEISWRVYQLEICPAAKRSHNGPNGALYGPHEHIGSAEPTAVGEVNVNCNDWSAGLHYFLAKAGLEPPTVTPP